MAEAKAFEDLFKGEVNRIHTGLELFLGFSLVLPELSPHRHSVYLPFYSRVALYIPESVPSRRSRYSNKSLSTKLSKPASAASVAAAAATAAHLNEKKKKCRRVSCKHGRPSTKIKCAGVSCKQKADCNKAVVRPFTARAHTQAHARTCVARTRLSVRRGLQSKKTLRPRPPPRAATFGEQCCR